MAMTLEVLRLLTHYSDHNNCFARTIKQGVQQLFVPKTLAYQLSYDARCSSRETDRGKCPFYTKGVNHRSFKRPSRGNRIGGPFLFKIRTETHSDPSSPLFDHDALT